VVSAPAPRRAVVLVGGPAAPYSRSIRIARALAAEGYEVEIAAVAVPGVPERDVVAGPAPGSAGEPDPRPGDGAIGLIEVHRYRPSGPWAVLGASEAAGRGAANRGTTGSGSAARAGARGSALRRGLRIATDPLLTVRRWLFWPHTVRGWWATLGRDLAPADLYHACGSLTVAAALAARDRAPIGPSGRPARVVYDAIDDVAESNAALGLPGPIARRNAATEARWARSADAVVTVNDALADRLAARWRLDRRPLVVPNLQEPPDPARMVGRPDHLRTAAGLAPSTRIVLFQGRLGPGLGLDEAADAVLRVPDAALVLLGFGRGLAASTARDADPRYAGRHLTLPARHPDELLAWTASADVAIVPLPPVSMNQRLSSPNKFWEALAAGTPVVVVAGLEVMEQLVLEHDLGAVAASVDPSDLAAAIGSVLDRLAAEGPAWRERIARTSAERFGWPPAATAYRSLIRSLVPAAR
jgi:glycosyltransferase involved in cell wall biosynthesis